MRADIPYRRQEFAIDVRIVGAEFVEKFVVAVTRLGLGCDFNCAESLGEFAVGEQRLVEFRAGDSELALRIADPWMTPVREMANDNFTPSRFRRVSNDLQSLADSRAL